MNAFDLLIVGAALLIFNDLDEKSKLRTFFMAALTFGSLRFFGFIK